MLIREFGLLSGARGLLSFLHDFHNSRAALLSRHTHDDDSSRENALNDDITLTNITHSDVIFNNRGVSLDH